MTNIELFRLAGRCLALDENPAFRTRLLTSIREEQINWDHFVSLCSNHLVLPAIYLQFGRHAVLPDLPEELSLHLQEIYRLNVSRNKRILEQIKQITTTLNEKNIYPLFMKGAGNLLDKVYTDIGERILGDIDFLVPEQDYLPAAELLMGQGYELADLKYLHDYVDLKAEKHYPRLFHPEQVAVIEIHRIPSDEIYLSWFNSATVTRDQKEPPLQTGCYVPSDRIKIIHNFVHGQLSNEGNLYGRISLREAYDLCLYSKRVPLTATLPAIKTQRKAIAYYALCRSILGLDHTFFPDQNFTFRILSFKLRLNQNSSLFYQLNRTVIFIAQRIFARYIGQIVKAVYSKEKRQYLLRRFRDPQWFGDHIGLYTRFFKRK